MRRQAEVELAIVRHFARLGWKLMTSSMVLKSAMRVAFCVAIACSGHAAEPARPTDLTRQIREYRDFAMGHDGSAVGGREVFNNEQGAGCLKCHSVDGGSSKAGPDLFAVGDRFPRGELIRAVLEPSA